MCLGYDADYSWPLWFEDREGKNIAVDMSPGDMIVYKGSEFAKSAINVLDTLKKIK